MLGTGDVGCITLQESEYKFFELGLLPGRGTALFLLFAGGAVDAPLRRLLLLVLVLLGGVDFGLGLRLSAGLVEPALCAL